jgi:hypothetical protein
MRGRRFCPLLCSCSTFLPLFFLFLALARRNATMNNCFTVEEPLLCPAILRYARSHHFIDGCIQGKWLGCTLNERNCAIASVAQLWHFLQGKMMR